MLFEKQRLFVGESYGRRITFDAIKLFVLYFLVMLAWMWNTQKLRTRDYITAVAATFVTPFVMQFAYDTIPIAWHPDIYSDAFAMVLLYLLLHMISNTFRRITRTGNH